jgi:hypothetical protein
MRGHESMKMTKLKRIFSMALASAMALSLVTVPAFAEETSENASAATTEAAASTTTETVESIPVSKTITVNSSASIPVETFTFTMTPATEDEINGEKVGNSNVVVEPGVALTDNDVTYSFASTDTANVGTDSKLTKSGEAFNITSANGVTFNHAGVYRYYIEESLPTTQEPYITYSNVKYMVDLYVYDDGSAYVPQGVSVTKIVPGESGETKTSVKPSAIDFENTINTYDLKISKVVDGTEYTRDEEFDFWIMIPTGGKTITLSQDAIISAQICDANGTVKSNVELKVNGNKDNATSDAAGYEYVKAQGTNFQLKNGQYLKVCAPATMIYYVVEDDYSGEGYTQVYKYDEEGLKASDTISTEGSIKVENDANKKVVNGTVNTAKNEVQFINRRQVTNTNTGISLEVAPYALIVLIAICGGILFAIRKRRVDR